MPRDLGHIIDEARRSALEPEQPLLRMVAQRRASRRVLTHAARCYSRAAELVGEAIAGLPEPPAKSGNEE